jgi:hypothetical protein
MHGHRSAPFFRLKSCLGFALALVVSTSILCFAADSSTPFTTDATDLWWNSAESGWGLQVVQEGNVAFATLYVYDGAGLPTFFVATLSESPPGRWSGDLYRGTGPYYGGGAFDPTRVVPKEVGTLSLNRRTSNDADLLYTVDGVQVSKSVTRQLLRNDDYTGVYSTIVTVTASHCSNSADNRTQTSAYTVRVDHNNAVFNLAGDFAHRAICNYNGPYTQSGRIGSAGTSYSCVDGDEGSMSFFELIRRPGMFSGRFQGHSISDSCDYVGSLTGLVPR